MGSFQSHVDVEHQRSATAPKQPHPRPGASQRNKAKSLDDEFPSQCEPVPADPSMSSHTTQETHRAPNDAPDSRFLNAPMPPAMNWTKVQDKALVCSRDQNAGAGNLSSQAHQGRGPGKTFSPIFRTDASNVKTSNQRGSTEVQVHFQDTPLKGVHGHARDRPRTPYPQSHRGKS